MKKIFIFIALLFSLGLISLLLGYSYYSSQLDKELPISEDTLFIIETGESVEEIISNLENENIIDKKQILILYLKQKPEIALNLKAGSFNIKKGATPKSLMETLQDPSANRDDISVLIQEGLRFDEIANLVQVAFSSVPESKFSVDEYLLISENPSNYSFSPEVDELLSKYKTPSSNLEGFLYPETYYFSKSSTAEEIINKQILTLSQELNSEDYSTLENSDYSMYEHLIIASMIEREAFAESEKADIADVIFKRLENGIQGVKLLQIDATLLYQAKDWKANPFLIKDIDGPYNTYKRTGLPPTPISNPGIDSLRASLYPNSNDYYFYLHDSKGQIHFAKNQSEHGANVAKYINN